MTLVEEKSTFAYQVRPVTFPVVMKLSHPTCIIISLSFGELNLLPLLEIS